MSHCSNRLMLILHHDIWRKLFEEVKINFFPLYAIKRDDGEELKGPKLMYCLLDNDPIDVLKIVFLLIFREWQFLGSVRARTRDESCFVKNWHLPSALAWANCSTTVFPYDVTNINQDLLYSPDGNPKLGKLSLPFHSMFLSEPWWTMLSAT